MTEKRQRMALAEACGWSIILCKFGDSYGAQSPEGDPPECWCNPREGVASFMPDYFNDYNTIQEAKEQLINTTQLRVKWINNLRRAIEHRMPKNKMGWPVITDVDLHFCTCPEHVEALLKTINKWEK